LLASLVERSGNPGLTGQGWLDSGALKGMGMLAWLFMRNAALSILLVSSSFFVSSAFGQLLPAAKAKAAVPATPTQASLSNRRAPSFSLPDSSFKQYDILDYRGKWLLIYFMSPTPSICSHCKELTAKLEDLKNKYKAKVEVLAIVSTPPETQATVAKYLAETKSTAPVLFDNTWVAMAYFKATPQNAAFDSPHLFAVNPQGTIVRDWNAPQTGEADLVPALEKLLRGAAAKTAPKAK
jgi:peroxiredoxin